MKNIVVGMGLSGAVISNLIANCFNEQVVIIDRRGEIGGNCRDFQDKNTGIYVHKYGPHIFHTNSDSVWKFLSSYTSWNKFEFKPKVMIDGKYITLPFNLNSIKEAFDENLAETLTAKLVKKYGFSKNISIYDLMEESDADLNFLADYVYKNVFEGYTAKQWGVEPEKVDRSVLNRVPVRISYDDRYFQDVYQGIPSFGYSEMIKNIVKNKNIALEFNTDFSDIKSKVLNSNECRVIYTGSVDELFDYEYGILPYRSLKFDFETLSIEHFQPTAMVNYPNDNEFTRIIEHKYFLDNESDYTIISKEFPEDFEPNKNERFYPIKNSNNETLYRKYLFKACQYKNLHLTGRLGLYKYLNMDETISHALNLFNKVLSRS